MEHFMPVTTNDFVTINNRARQLRAEVMAKGVRSFRVWVVRHWANLISWKDNQPA